MSAVTLNNPVASLNALRRLAETTSVFGQSFERLSSGLRINRAKDDAAGLSIFSSLSFDARILSSGIRNLNDGISMMNVAEAATKELSSLVMRVRELATQAANGAISDTQRGSLNEEAGALMEEYRRIVKSTNLNGIPLLDGTFQMLTLQVGYASLNVGLGTLETETCESQSAVADGTLEPFASIAGSALQRQVIAVDVNKDGRLDLVTASEPVPSLAAYLGNGDGTFQAASNFSGGGNSFGVAAGDLNSDGLVDLVNASPGNNRVYIQLGNGDGTFGPPSNSTFGNAGPVPLQVTLGDVNHDGRLDLAVNSSGIRILIGNGDGTFGVPTFIAGGTDPSSAPVMADVNADGNIDVLHVNSGSDRIYVTLGIGGGTFAAPSFFFGGDVVSKLVVADANEDGRPDLLTVSQTEGRVGVHIGNGDGTFQARVTYLAGPNPVSLTVLDLNQDGRIDVATASTGQLNVLLGNGDGSFSSPTQYSAGSGLGSLVSGDFNGDGIPDLAGIARTDNAINLFLAHSIALVLTCPSPSIDISTQAAARSSLAYCDSMLSTVLTFRGLIGASLSRLQAAVSTLRQNTEDVLGAKCRITDIDVAEESAHLIKGRILQQAGAAVLSQANQLPALAETLLEVVGLQPQPRAAQSTTT